MSTAVRTPHLEPSWKQEVNRRVAAHMNRKGASDAAPEKAGEAARPSASRRAAEAAARVAARYANAPSYSEVLADEARAALRAAEAASRAAQQAHAAAASVLAGIEAAAVAEPETEPDAFAATVAERYEELAPVPAWPQPELVQPQPQPQPAQPEHDAHAVTPAFAVRWDLELPVRPAAPPAAYTSHEQDFFTDDGRSPAAQERSALEAESIQMVDAAQPIPANLIEFPRELVAARKARPRRAEGPYLADAGAQLSIFEVDPATIATEPAPVEAVDDVSAPAWTGPEWSDIQLDAQPEEQILAEPAPVAVPAPELELAPMHLRLMAALVDGALIVSALAATAALVARNASALPSLRASEIGAAVALLLVATAYEVLFFTLGKATPGMRYARVQLCTLDGQSPTRSQRTSRLAALLLSMVPVGLGLAWALFDEDRLTWHDRLSGTYLRRYY